VKPLAFPRPSGHTLALEWDIFYPLPSSWYKPTKPTKAAQKPEPITPAPEIIETWNPHGDPHSVHPGEIWIPSGGWSSDSDVIKSLSEADTKGEKRIWSEVDEVNANETTQATKFQFLLFRSKPDQTNGMKIIYSVFPRQFL
jgi:hypothetical protein